MSKKKESRLDAELHAACRRGDLLRAQRILDTGRVHVDCYDEENGIGPLMLAAQLGYDDIARVLLDEGGADVNEANQEGGTALMCACQWGHVAVAMELMRRTCNIHKAMLDGTTALFLAAQAGHAGVVRLLIEECQRRERDVGIFVASPRKDGSSPLFIAAQMGHTEAVKALLENGAEVDQSRLDDATPLFKACHKGHLGVVRLLLRHQARVGMLQNGETCLHASVLSGQVEVVKEVLSTERVDVHLQNGDGFTAYDMAKRLRHEEISQLLKPLTIPASPASSSPVKSSLTSIISSSSSSTSSKDTLKQNSPKQQQHVRFALHDQTTTAAYLRERERGRMRRLHPARSLSLSAPVRVHCKMLTTQDMIRREQEAEKSPVRLVWRNSPSTDKLHSISRSECTSSSAAVAAKGMREITVNVEHLEEGALHCCRRARGGSLSDTTARTH